jgi:hypothetical protein
MEILGDDETGYYDKRFKNYDTIETTILKQKTLTDVKQILREAENNYIITILSERQDEVRNFLKLSKEKYNEAKECLDSIKDKICSWNYNRFNRKINNRMLIVEDKLDLFKPESQY